MVKTLSRRASCSTRSAAPRSSMPWNLCASARSRAIRGTFSDAIAGGAEPAWSRKGAAALVEEGEDGEGIGDVHPPVIVAVGGLRAGQVPASEEEAIKKAVFSFATGQEFQLALQRTIDGSIRQFVATTKQSDILGMRAEIVD